MKTGSIFSDIYQIALGIGLMILIPMVVHQISDIAFPTPSRSDYITVDYETSTKEYRKQQDLYQEARKPVYEKHFYIQTIAGIILLIISMIVEPPLTLGFLLAGLICFSMGYFTSWDIITKMARLISLIIASILIIVAGIRFKEKK